MSGPLFSCDPGIRMDSSLTLDICSVKVVVGIKLDCLRARLRSLGVEEPELEPLSCRLYPAKTPSCCPSEGARVMLRPGESSRRVLPIMGEAGME